MVCIHFSHHVISNYNIAHYPNRWISREFNYRILIRISSIWNFSFAVFKRNERNEIRCVFVLLLLLFPVVIYESQCKLHKTITHKHSQWINIHATNYAQLLGACSAHLNDESSSSTEQKWNVSWKAAEKIISWWAYL